MTKNNPQTLAQTTAVGALVVSFWFVYSVIANIRDLIQHDIKNAPASYALISCLILLACSWYKSGKKFALLHVITLTILLTSIVIWFAGASARAM